MSGGLTSFPAHAQPLGDLNVVFEVSLSQHYSLLAQITQRYSIAIDAIVPPHKIPAVLILTFSFDFLSVDGLPQGANYSLFVESQHPFVSSLTVVIPPSYNQFNLTVAGRASDYSVLYRSAATVNRVRIELNIPPFSPTSYKLLVPDLPGLDIFTIFPLTGISRVLAQGNSTVISEKINIGGAQFILADFPDTYGSLVLLYQTTSRDFFLFYYFAILVAFILAFPVAWRRVRPRLGNPLPRLLPLFWRTLSSLSPKKLLGLFALSCLLMISLSVAVGPPPVPRVYFSATPQTVTVVGPYIVKAGYQYLTPLDAADQIDAMSELGNYNAFVIADYPIAESSLGLYSSYRIYVMTSYVPQSYLAKLTDLYGNTTVIAVSSDQRLTDLMTSQRIYLSTNRLGLPISLAVYDNVARIEAVLTLVITFFALAFLSRSIVEGGARGWVFMAEAVVLAFLVYLFTTTVFIQTSVLFGLPVALHAAISSVESATGLLGFGGGSRPRELAGILGFIFGVLSAPGGRMKLDRVGVLAFAGLVVYVATDPLTLGKIFYGLVLNIATSESGGASGLVLQETIRLFLGQTMSFFGNNVSNLYLMSHGAVLFYAAAVPFAVFSRVGKTTSTFLLLFSSFAASVGFIRTADLNPIESLASALPGIALGLFLAGLFLLASLAEARLRKLIT
ncbi:MAG: hypothetical protein OK422_00315 [Thaumarchaeota archaeon]|nr:hypothetical protein [Nitrososphaerota archaeon]